MLHAGSYVPFASHLDLVARQSLAGIQPSKRIPYTKSKYIQRIPLEQILFCTPWERGRNTMAGVREGFAPWESQVYQLAPLRPPLRVSPLAQGGGGKRPPLSAVHPKKKGNAKRPRVYSKASPPPAPRIKEKSIHFSAPVPLFVNFVDFRKFRVGDGGGYYMGPVQLILSFSCFCGRFREFRVMIFTPEESLTRNRNTPA